MFYLRRIKQQSRNIAVETHRGDDSKGGVRKIKMEFNMAFAMKGGGLEGVLSATYLF